MSFVICTYVYALTYACMQVRSVAMCVLYMCLCVYIYVCVSTYVCICVHTCDHLHLVLLQILENHFVSFHPVQKLLQHFHTYSNINTLIHTVLLLSHHVQLKHVACESIEQYAEFYINPSTSFLYP